MTTEPEKIHNERLSLRRAAILLIRKEGFYRYANMVVESRSKNEDFFMRHYNKPKQEVVELHEKVFADCCNHSYTVDEYLENVRTLTNWSMPPELDLRSKTK